MNKEKINTCMMNYQQFIPSDKTILLRDRLERAADESYDTLMITNLKNPTTVLLLSIFLGGIGVDRFYIGDTGLGVAKLLLGWLTFGIWPLIDIFLVYKKVKEQNLDLLLSALS